MAKKRSGVAATNGQRERSGVAGRGLGDEEGARESTMLKRGKGASVSAGGRPTDALLSAGGTN